MNNFNHLYYFYLIVKFDGITNAAKYLKLSQSSLSIQLKQLEESLGKKLLIKNGRKLVLTPEGQRVYSYCKVSFENFDQMNQALTKNLSGRTRLRIGITNEIERPFISTLLGQLINSDIKKDITVNMQSNTHKMIEEMFLVRDVDLAITVDPIINSGIKYSAVVELPIGIFISQKNLKVPNKDIKIKKFLLDNPLGLALPSTTLKLRKEIDSFLAKEKITKKISFETNIISAISRVIIENAAIGFLPIPYMYMNAKEGKLVKINTTDKLWSQKIYIYSYSEELLKEIQTKIVKYNSYNF